MAKLIRYGVVVLGILMVASLARGQASRDVTATMNDAWITTQIHAKFFLDPDIKGRDINVDTTGGVVTLTGEVHSASEHSQALAKVTEVAAGLAQLGVAARRSRYDLTLHIVGRADPSGTESDNLTLSRRRAVAVRDRLVALGVPTRQVVVDAAGSNDPLPADVPAERARLNRSASFVVRAQPASRGGGTERAR